MCNIRYAALFKMPREIMCVHVYIRTYMYVCTVHMYCTYVQFVHVYCTYVRIYDVRMYVSVCVTEGWGEVSGRKRMSRL